MKLSDVINSLNGKRLTVILEVSNCHTNCEIYCEKSRVFIKQNKANKPTHVVFMNEDFEQIAIDLSTIKSLTKKESTYTFDCGNLNVLVR